MTKNNDRAQLFLFFFVVVFLIAVLFVTPSLQLISLLTVLNVLFLSPLVSFLQRKRMNRILAILVVFTIAGFVVAFSINWISGVAITQLTLLAQSLPGFSYNLLQQIKSFETSLQTRFDVHIEFGLSNLVSQAGSNSTTWLVSHLTGLLSGIASATFLVPIFSFFILKDGKEYKSEILRLIPQRYYAEIVTTLSKTTSSLSKFLRAKALEALLVAVLTYIGLLIFGAPYAAVLALIAGVTNILPYIGPILGIIPAIALLGFSWPILIIYAIVNGLDMLIVFPILVGKLVNLSPLTLLISVAVGQELYGLVGMLISVPVASSIKIIYLELVEVLYHRKLLE